jgi:hypothetical protein
MRIKTERIRRQSDRFGCMFSTITATGQDQCNGILTFVSSGIDMTGTNSKDITHHHVHGYTLHTVPPAFLGVRTLQKQ